MSEGSGSPAPARGIPGLGVLDPPLAYATPARPGPFRVAGREMAVLGELRAGITASATRWGLLTGPVRLEGAPPPVAANLLQTPGLLRRELTLPGRTLLETVVVPRRLAGFAVQWEGAGSADGSGSLTAAVALPPPADGPQRWRDDGGTLRVTGPGAGPGCLLHLDPPGSWTVEEGADGLLARGAWPPGPRGPRTLLLAALDPEGRSPSLSALAGLEAHRRQAARTGRGSPGIRLETGVAELDDGVAWARAVVEAARGPGAPLPEPAPAPGSLPYSAGEVIALLLEPAARPGWTALGALAGGDFALARALLPAPGDHPLGILALAEWVAWTGDPGPFLAARRELADALDATAPAPGAAGALRGVLRRRVADAAQAVGHSSWAEELRGPPLTPSGSVRRLPTLPRGDGAGPLLEALLGDAPAGGGPAALPVPGAAELPPAAALIMARAWYAADRPEAGLPALRDALGVPLRRGPPVSPLVPALALRALVSGLLGARPDASVGRLALAPRLPGTWTRFVLRGLALGDTTLDVDFRREGGRHVWRFLPTAGAVPPMLILEPTFPLSRITSVQVDGRPAELDVEPRGDRTLLRLQLPLDSERSLSVDGS